MCPSGHDGKMRLPERFFTVKTLFNDVPTDSFVSVDSFQLLETAVMTQPESGKYGLGDGGSITHRVVEILLFTFFGLSRVILISKVRLGTRFPVEALFLFFPPPPSERH
jgi:hypothetical protein